MIRSPDAAIETNLEPARYARPLVVDVDHLLHHRDLLADVLLSAIRHPTAATPKILLALARGRTAANRHLARSNLIDPARLTYDSDVTTYLLQQLGAGRQIVVASSRYDEGLVNAIAQHLGLSAAPLDRGEDFDYLGAAATPLPAGAARVEQPVAARDAGSLRGWRLWFRLLRVHQYAKNALVMVPLVTAHQFSWLSACQAVLAAVAFSLTASSAYIINDLLDVAADRAHPTKRHRPIAQRAVTSRQALVVTASLFAAALGVGATLSPAFLAILLLYFVLTTVYSFRLKRIAIADVVTLAGLYTIRVVAGAIAISVTMSEWLFAFSLFIFMSLALVKRYVELTGRQPGERLMARDYRSDDLPMVAALAAASGFNAVVIFTLYISSDTVRSLYSHPQILWISCPVLMYWFGRVMLLAQRGLIDDDPVIFALQDRASWVSLGIIGITLFAAM